MQKIMDIDRTHKVLYIEDNPANLRLVEQILKQRKGIDLICASEGGLGMELAIQHKPDLILLDIMLPDFDGYEILEILQRNEETREIPVVAISANAMPADIEKGRRAGFNEYLIKPVDIERLLETVDIMLQ